MTVKMTLQDLLDPAAQRMDDYRAGAGSVAEDTYCLTFADRQCYATRAELALIEARLPGVIDIFAAVKNAREVPSLVATTLHSWLYPRITSPGLGPNRFFYRIRDIKMPAAGSIHFNADTYLVYDNRAGVPVAGNASTNLSHRLGVHDLEAQYPGSVARLQMGLEIGLDDESLVRLITDDGGLSPLELPTLTII